MILVVEDDALQARLLRRLLERAGLLGDGWFPLVPPNEHGERAVEKIRRHLEASGRDIATFGIEAQARIAGGECALRRRPDGKPFLDSGHSVSASHAAGHTLAIVGSRSTRMTPTARSTLQPSPRRLPRPAGVCTHTR